MNAYKEGDIINGTVTGIEDYGIFLSFGDNCSGLIHISEISNLFVKDPHEYASLNDKMSAKIISMESRNHYKLSIKDIDNGITINGRKSETKNGFETLASNLDIWIKESMKKIDKKAKKNK